jgi:Transposase
LPSGPPARTLRDAANYIKKLPKSEHETPEWRLAIQMLLRIADQCCSRKWVSFERSTETPIASLTRIARIRIGVAASWNEYVKPYVKRQKNDMADAEAICEAVTRANMRFVPTKTPEQQSCLMLHRTRHLFIRQQTAVINSIRAHLAEFGIVAPVGRSDQCLDWPVLKQDGGYAMLKFRQFAVLASASLAVVMLVATADA